jgi:hypothetical protein
MSLTTGHAVNPFQGTEIPTVLPLPYPTTVVQLYPQIYTSYKFVTLCHRGKLRGHAVVSLVCTRIATHGGKLR